MALLDVELGEVILSQFNLGAVNYIKAHADKDVLDLVKNIVHGVLVTYSLLYAGQSDVDSFVNQLLLHHLAAKLFLALFQCALNLGAQLVCQLTHDGALLSGELAHLLEDCGELTLLAQVFYSEGFQFFNALAGQNGLDGGLSESLHLFFHTHFLLSVFPVKK